MGRGIFAGGILDCFLSFGIFTRLVQIYVNRCSGGEGGLLGQMCLYEDWLFFATRLLSVLTPWLWISGDTAAAILSQTLLRDLFVCLGRASHRIGTCQTYVGKFCFLILGAENVDLWGTCGTTWTKNHISTAVSNITSPTGIVSSVNLQPLDRTTSKGKRIQACALLNNRKEEKETNTSLVPKAVRTL